MATEDNPPQAGNEAGRYPLSRRIYCAWMIISCASTTMFRGDDPTAVRTVRLRCNEVLDAEEANEAERYLEGEAKRRKANLQAMKEALLKSKSARG
ncbi:uncharacterized protein AFUA_3G02690 [Aspergillus fumigatus Af293]|uniref:Uncharacterized protein n=1 Tax=Aspergillus fumigatus (strain ATCC MYA-4609 / CBS 101355 / FGSC A1100 / Af293) TaxID=330879 RepID=Q4WFC4_ASPFU|nr:conserved hypothetical protein [Aspergillus fumigatus Af293]EAL86553.1 conserved hypothetical protein [Aspergillus fumigatus Af293]